eukprot:5058831-Alexandrium_andersonii.AAC.1
MVVELFKLFSPEARPQLLQFYQRCYDTKTSSGLVSCGGGGHIQERSPPPPIKLQAYQPPWVPLQGVCKDPSYQTSVCPVVQRQGNPVR